MYNDDCLYTPNCTNDWDDPNWPNKCINCQKAWFISEQIDDGWIEIRYSYNDLECLKWLWDLKGICPIPGEEEDEE